MVIPIGGLGPQIRGPIPDECQHHAQRVKFTVLGLVASLLGRVACATYMGLIQKEFFNLLNLVMVIVIGIFVMKDDARFELLQHLGNFVVFFLSRARHGRARVRDALCGVLWIEFHL